MTKAYAPSVPSTRSTPRETVTCADCGDAFSLSRRNALENGSGPSRFEALADAAGLTWEELWFYLAREVERRRAEAPRTQSVPKPSETDPCSQAVRPAETV
jgi:hypothetical protein